MPVPEAGRPPFRIPTPKTFDIGEMYHYLYASYKIPCWATKSIHGWGLVYRELGPYTAVFVNPERTFVERHDGPVLEIMRAVPDAFCVTPSFRLLKSASSPFRWGSAVLQAEG